MVNGIQVSSLKPLLLTAEQVQTAFAQMKAIGCDTVQLQWIDPAVPIGEIAGAVQENGMASLGTQDFYVTVQENLALMCGIYGYDANKRAEKTEELVRTFHLESVLHKRAGKLSGGWQRRLSIAMALVGEPQVLFLDEPTLGLDVIARSELWDTIRALKNKATIILTTHYMEEAEALSDRIGIMKAGRLIALGTAQALKEKAGADTFESAFIALVKEG